MTARMLEALSSALRRLADAIDNRPGKHLANRTGHAALTAGTAGPASHGTEPEALQGMTLFFKAYTDDMQTLHCRLTLDKGRLAGKDGVTRAIDDACSKMEDKYDTRIECIRISTPGSYANACGQSDGPPDEIHI